MLSLEVKEETAKEEKNRRYNEDVILEREKRGEKSVINAREDVQCNKDIISEESEERGDIEEAKSGMWVVD